MLLKGRVAVLAGVGPGMGRDVALALAREGQISSSAPGASEPSMPWPTK